MTTFASVLYLEALLTSRLVSSGLVWSRLKQDKTFLSLVKQASSWPRHSIHLSAPLSLSRSLALSLSSSAAASQSNNAFAFALLKKGWNGITHFFFHDDEKKK